MNGQLLGRDLNPLDIQLLLRTDTIPIYSELSMVPPELFRNQGQSQSVTEPECQLLPGFPRISKSVLCPRISLGMIDDPVPDVGGGCRIPVTIRLKVRR